jgi:hypothetical protein
MARSQLCCFKKDLLTVCISSIDRNKEDSSLDVLQDVQTILGDHKKKASDGSNILSFIRKTRRHALGSKATQDNSVEQH